MTQASSHQIGTGRGHSRSLVLELGADRFVALETERLEDAVGQADLVFDAAGGDVLARSASVLKPGGTLVSVAAFPPFGRSDAFRGGYHGASLTRSTRQSAVTERTLLQTAPILAF